MFANSADPDEPARNEPSHQDLHCGADPCLDETDAAPRSMSKGSEKGRWLQWTSHHRVNRSSVRPFFCCGSQVSLNSITEFKDLAVVPERGDEDYEDITSDSDDLLENVESLRIDTTLTLHNGRKSDKQRQTRIPSSKRKKGVNEKSTTGRKFWTLKLKGKLRVNKSSRHRTDTEPNESSSDGDLCVCTSYRATTSDANTSSNVNDGSEERIPFSVLAQLVPAPSESSGVSAVQPSTSVGRLNDVDAGTGLPLDRPLAFVNLEEMYPVSGIDEQRIAQRRAEMEQGIEVETVWVHKTEQSNSDSTSNVCSSCGDRPVGQYPSYGAMGLLSQVNLPPRNCSSTSNGGSSPQSTLNLGLPWSPLMSPPQGVHTQVDYIHYLVADLQKIIGSCFYWGVMDRYQAEKLIENKPEGTFLLRDSAQDEFLFSVSFRRYGRSLHARIEQWNHNFSFDSRDPGVFAADSVCGLINHYKDPSRCMFFEPMLTLPLHRTFPFSLQHLTRSVICSRLTYDGVNDLPLPRTLKEYLRFYHYKQKIRVRRFDTVS